MSIKLKGSSDGSVSFDAPADTSPSGSDITLTLPTSAGSANQFLKNSGIAGELEYSSMVETSTGVGIGESSPDSILQVTESNSGGNTELIIQNSATASNSNCQIHFKTNAGGNEKTRALITAAGNTGSAGDLIFSTRQSGNTTEAMRLDSSGNLIQYSTSTLERQHRQQSSSSYTATNIRSVISGAAASLAFDTNTNWTNGNAVERAQITNAGRFKVTDSAGSGSVHYTNANFSTFHSSTGSNLVASFEHTHSSDPYGIAIRFSSDNPDNNGNYFLTCQDSTHTRLTIFSDGDIDNHDNSYSGFSDVKLKQDIVDAGSQWEDIKNLRVRKFKFKADVAAYGDEAKTLIGVVAQETELVSPGLVKESPDLDENNNDLGTTTKSVRYSVLYMKAVKALQEAQTRIETLESQHADLLARVTALEAA